jgi:hypothetical protein
VGTYVSIPCSPSDVAFGELDTGRSGDVASTQRIDELSGCPRDLAAAVVQAHGTLSVHDIVAKLAGGDENMGVMLSRLTDRITPATAAGVSDHV